LDILSPFKYLNHATELFGLIGDPVSKSLSHMTHNAAMRDLKMDRVYHKFHVPQDHLEHFISQAKKAGVKGLSVTMPLKEKIIPLIDEIHPWAAKVGAVNTLKFENGKILGYNTDGKGALDSIEAKMNVHGKKMVFIGAGGAAKAVIAEAIDRGAIVTILNRDVQKALDLAEKMGCKGGSLENMAKAFHEGYDILVNTTPSPMPIDAQWIIPNTIVMDIKTQPLNTELIKQAKLKGCALVYGYEMFVNQAVEQYRIWFGEKIDLNKVKITIEETVLKHIEKE
jgi:3-dehydroquinate dehydratase/shikimate dehydrogenase